MYAQRSNNARRFGAVLRRNNTILRDGNGVADFNNDFGSRLIPGTSAAANQTLQSCFASNDPRYAAFSSNIACNSNADCLAWFQQNCSANDREVLANAECSALDGTGSGVCTFQSIADL